MKSKFQRHFKFQVPPLSQKIRLSDYKPKSLSSSAFKKKIKAKKVHIDGKLAKTSDYIIGGEHIEIQEEIQLVKDPGINLKVYYEDDYLAIIHKPAGVLVSGNKHRTISNALPYVLNINEDHIFKPEPIHRLDYETSGLLLCGKSNKSLELLGNMFANGDVQKTYLAVCIGKFKEQKGQINEEIDGKESISKYEIINSFKSDKYEVLSLVKIVPKTGRKHQIRKHLYGIGHPVLGDKKYNIEGKLSVGNGLYLHAYRLKFKHPQIDLMIDLKSDIPKKFASFF